MTNLPNLQKLEFTDVLKTWDQLDERGTDTEMMSALCLVDRFYLLVKVLGRIDAFHPWIYARCREVELAPDNHLDIWGRGHYKSTIITFAGIIQDILMDPEVTVGIFSHTRSIAKAFLSQIKLELELNDRLKRLFPDVLYAKPERESPRWSLDDGIIVRRQSNPKEATVEAWGLVDGQPTSRHFKILLYDDVVTDKSVTTPEQIAKTTEAWQLSDNLGSLHCRKRYVGTRYSYADTYEAMIKQGSVILRHRPATDDGTMDGHPVLLTPEQWRQKIIDQGDEVVACQLLGNPLSGTQKMFNVEDIQVYEARPNTLNVYIMIDPARSVKRDSANTAMVVIGIDYAGNKYLLDGHDRKMDLQERWQYMRDLWRTWRAAAGVQNVEVGYERYGAISDLDYFKERQDLEGQRFPITELEWPREGPGSKIDRVQRLGPDFRSHRFYVPYKTDEKNLTALQRRMEAEGYGYRVARPIRRKDETGATYDLVERFRLQVHYFPFGGLKDIVDAASRIYDMDPRPPIYYDEAMLEPEVV